MTLKPEKGRVISIGRATMLVVTLKENEKVLIGKEISIMVVDIRGAQIRLGIQAPDDLLVLREKAGRKKEA